MRKKEHPLGRMTLVFLSALGFVTLLLFAAYHVFPGEINLPPSDSGIWVAMLAAVGLGLFTFILVVGGLLVTRRRKTSQQD